MLDFIFPRVCPFCESASKDGKICIGCLAGIKFIKEMSVCLRCGVPFGYARLPDHDKDVGVHGSSLQFLEHPGKIAHTSVDSTSNHLCGECLLDGFYFDKARSVAFYDGPLRDVLHKFKYEGKLNLGGALSDILTMNFPDDLDTPNVIIPVPLYIGRLRKREYNQSVILGGSLAKYLRIPFDPFAIKRVRDTKPQFEIKTEDEKRRNVKGAFSVENKEKIRGKSVLIIDDVFTTGSTIDECARVLLDADALCVQVVTLMRAVQV